MEEDVGNDYCNEFLHRSVLQYDDTTESKDRFIMHDLIYDLAQFVAKDEYSLLTNPKPQNVIPKTIRHVSVYMKDGLEMMELLREAEHLRTLMVRVPGGIQIMDLLPNLTCLRTLVLNTWEPVELPDSIGCLIHLRYLEINDAKSIPASVYNLHFLQTLNFVNPGSEVKLSRDVGDLINLRHLRGDDMDQVINLPREVIGLTNLQTLSCITIGVGSDDGEGWKMKDLKGLSNLRGRLALRGLKSVPWPDVTPPEAYLKDKRGLKELSLLWEYDAREEVERDADERLAAQVSDSLQPHPNLKILGIHYFPCAVLPTWLGHELPALQHLYINGLRGVKSFAPPFGKKSEGCDGFQLRSSLNPPAAAAASPSSTSTEDVFDSRHWFPSLEDLTIRSMEKLELQGAEDRDFLPCLRRLFVVGCPKLRTFPSLSHLAHLAINGCPELRRLPSLPSLTQLWLGEEFSPEFLNGCCLRMLRSLRILCYSGESLILPNDGSLDSLEELSLTICLELRSIEGLGDLASLQHLGAIWLWNTR